MLKPRIIPVLLYKDGVLVRSKGFNFFQATGDPIRQVERFTEWKADELIYLDISRGSSFGSEGVFSVIGSTSSKKMLGIEGAGTFTDIISVISQKCFIPLTVGGKVRTVDDVRVRLRAGADKVSINTKALEEPGFLREVAAVFGAQCVVCSMDVRYNPDSGKYEVFSHFGTTATGRDPVEWAREVEQMGAGEILLNSIDRDGVGTGYDLELVHRVADAVQIPVIALGGVGSFAHLVDGLTLGHASAVAAANIFHFTEQSIIQAKQYMKNAEINVRL